jgi:hypothetical protein
MWHKRAELFRNLVFAAVFTKVKKPALHLNHSGRQGEQQCCQHLERQQQNDRVEDDRRQTPPEPGSRRFGRAIKGSGVAIHRVNAELM